VPIPPTLTRALDDYRRYLFTLASHLSDTNALLAGAITSISLPNEASTVPLFFFLERKNCGLGWGSVSAQSLKATGLFDWPLPPNLFRQRLSKRLRQRGLDGEIIDALMGHSEQNCMTYADDSTRVWSADMAVARDHLAACFNSLGFKFSNVWRIGETCWPPGPSTQSARAFGIRARALERQATIDRAHEQAESIIAEFCQGRAIIDFSEDELYELSKKLMLSPNGTPITTGYERYSILERMLAKAWEEQGQRVRLSRRFFRVRPSPSPHTVACVGAMRWLNGARSLLTKIDSDVVDRSIHVKRLHAAILLCIEARIADPDLLAAVRQGTTYRIMHYERQCYLEYGATAGDGPDALVRRFPISHSLGNQLSALTAADRSSATLLSDRRIPQRYAVLIRTHRHTVGDRSHSPLNEQAFWRALGQQMDAVNVMDLPGCLAASYAGRCRPVSLTWRDTIRLRTGKVADFTTISSLDDKSTLASVAEDANLNWITPLPGISPDETELQPRARQFLKQLTGLLPTQSDSLKTSATPSRRRDLGLQIRKLVRDFNGRISPTVLMLGQWVESLVIRGSRASKPLAMSTISRYAVTLKRAFLELAYAIDIRSLDDEALTDFYAAVLSSNDFDRPDYVAARLAQFHYWASPLGVAEPDWGAMPVTVVAPSRSPGWIGESDYIRALVCLQGDRAEPDLTLIRAFVLLASYRFGLRSSESLGLSRRDWVEQGSVTVVLVRNMPWRSLKSPASRRQVPLLFLLTKQECDLINQVMARAQALWGDDMDTCLLGRSAEVRLPPEVGWIRPHIIRILKHVTGNPHINLHHTRHSAANRATSAVLQLKERFAGTAYPAQPTPQIADDIGTILLGHGGPSRRQSWALGRYLGHAGTQTIWNSYLHIHDVWAVECGIGKTATIEPQSLLDNVINLDAVPLSHPVDTQLLAYQAAVPRALTPMLAVGCLRLLANTTDASVCAEALNLAAADGQRIGDIATQIGHRLVLSKSKSNTKRVATDDYDFLRRITPSGWTRLLQTSSSMVPGLLRANQSTDSANAQARVCELVGASGQLLMWESWHGDFIRGFLNAAGIEETQYRVLRTKRWEPALDAMLAAWKFEARADDDRIRRVQIDPALAVSAALSATRRAALVWRECSTGAIRNRLEMLVLLAAYGACQR
jgi:hypothetical protein